ncbi:MAG: hypothetical protein AB1696_16365 [Planctomycetota bacterium]
MNKANRWSVVCVVLCIVMIGPAVQAGDSTPAYKEAAPIGVSPATKARSVSNFCVGHDGDLWVCDKGGQCVKIITTTDELRSEVRLPFAPEAVCRSNSGTMLVVGSGQMARVTASGRIEKQVAARDLGADGTEFTSITADGGDVFFTCRGNTGYDVYRTDGRLGAAAKIITGLRGCCGQMDITARDGAVFVAENARKRVTKYDRNGKALFSWGSNATSGLDGFGSCCNPMNICFDKDGNLCTSEARLGRVKRYTPDGKLLGLVGTVQSNPGCVRVQVEHSKDGSKVFVLDTVGNRIQVLEKL